MSRLVSSVSLLVALVVLVASAPRAPAQDDNPVILDNCPDGYATVLNRQQHLIDLSFNPSKGGPFKGKIRVSDAVKLYDASGKQIRRDDFFRAIARGRKVHVTYEKFKRNGKFKRVTKLELK